MDVRAFAEARRLRVRRDEDNTRIIPGRHGHIWDHGDDLFGVTLLDLTPRKWTHRKKLCLEAGMELQQDGDFEGTLLFDPTDSNQVQVALKVAGVKRKRRVSPEQIERLKAMSARNRIRKNSPVEGQLPGNYARGESGRGSSMGSNLSKVSFSGANGSEAA